jgi:phage gp45-like
MNVFESLSKKIMLLFGRGGVTNIDNSDSGAQKIQASLFDGESISDIERYQEYGLETYIPIENSESVILFFNGNRNANRAISICSHNRKYRPNDLQSGEVCLYSKDSLKTNKNRITIKPTNDIIIETVLGDKIEIKNTGIINITASSSVNVNGNTHPAIFGDDLVTAFDTWCNLWKNLPAGTLIQDTAILTAMQGGVAALIALLTAAKSTKVKVG